MWMNYDIDIQFSKLTMQIDASRWYLWGEFVSGGAASHYGADKGAAGRHLSLEQLQIAKYFITNNYKLWFSLVN